MIPNQIVRQMLCALIAASLTAALAGCLSKRESTPGYEKVFIQSVAHQTNHEEYVIDPPDEITIQAPNIKEIDKVKTEVRPDGKVALNLLGEVRLAGLTPEQACDKLKEIAGKYYIGPDIKIDVTAKSKFYMVFGPGAAAPSKKAWTGNDSMLKAIAEAGFNYQEAWPQQVLLSRPRTPGEKPVTVVVDFTRIAEYGDLSQNYVIEQGDIIDMRDSPLAHFNRKFDQLVGPLTGAGGAADAGNSMAATVHPGAP